jgi:hypothetical protein
MWLPIALFAFAAVGGVVLAVPALSGRKPSLPIAAIHGLVAAAGLVCLLTFAVRADASSGTRIALGLLVTAALGGFVLLAQHLRDRPLPRGLVVIHALAAVAGFMVLGWGALSGGAV